jgi:L-ascorbate metabolism protein UlaG (beta-lactamase superfamily)
MKITYYGHSCFLVEIAGKKLLFDPFITGNPLATHIDIDKIEADVILLSHGHGDHVADAVSIANRTNALVISNYEIIEWMGQQGAKNGYHMNFGGTYRADWGSVKYTHAIHSSVLPDGTYGGNPGGFVVETQEGTFWYSGDTALTYDFKLIAEEFNLDLCLLPIGDTFTMGYRDAAKCAQFVNCKKIIGLHYDTFPPIKIDHEEAIKAFRQKETELFLLKVGEEREF